MKPMDAGWPKPDVSDILKLTVRWRDGSYFRNRTVRNMFPGYCADRNTLRWSAYAAYMCSSIRREQ